jgi:outer membrane biosynthesis protein TonB
MGISAFISICLHFGLVAIAYFGIPSLRHDVMLEAPILVEIVNVAEITNAPPKQVKQEKKVNEEAPKPIAKVAPKPMPKIEPVLAEEPKEVVIVPPPPEAKPKLKPKPKPIAKKKQKAPAVLAKIKPKRKPKFRPQDTFASVLKTVAGLNSQTAQGELVKPQKKKPEQKLKSSFEEQITKALGAEQRSFDQSRVISISEIDYVRQQITKCWSPPAGAKDARNMIIEIAVSMNLDGTVRDARINNTGLQTDSFLRAMAESALRAVLNRHCQPFKLPRDKYDRWKTMKLVFNPKEMLGG